MVVEEDPWVWELATWVPVNAKKRKRKVPANSPAMAMKWLRILSGLEQLSVCFHTGSDEAGGSTHRKPRKGTLFSFEAIALALIPGKTKPPVR